MSDSSISSSVLGNPFASPSEGFCEVLLVRHGEQAYTENMKIGDAIDPPLSDLGRTQAEAVGRRLLGRNIQAVYASPLQRAADTGRAIADAHGLDLHLVDALREVDLWSGLPQDKSLIEIFTGDELRELFRDIQEQRRWDAYRYGEGSQAFRDRIVPAIDEIAAAHHGERVAVACHGGVIATLIAEYVDSPRDYCIAVHHTSITTVRVADDRRLVIQVNDFEHVHEFQEGINPLNLH